MDATMGMSAMQQELHRNGCDTNDTSEFGRTKEEMVQGSRTAYGIAGGTVPSDPRPFRHGERA